MRGFGILFALALVATPLQAIPAGGYHLCSDEGHKFSHHLGHPCDESNLYVYPSGNAECYSLREPARGIQCPSRNADPATCTEEHTVGNCNEEQAEASGIPIGFCRFAAQTCGPGGGKKSCIGDRRKGVDSYWGQIKCKRPKPGGGTLTITESCWEN